jgi:hypothetical protein
MGSRENPRDRRRRKKRGTTGAQEGTRTDRRAASSSSARPTFKKPGRIVQGANYKRWDIASEKALFG